MLHYASHEGFPDAEKHSIAQGVPADSNLALFEPVP
jgi:hypothetical protein